MSSSSTVQVQATPWSLDELEMPEIFAPLPAPPERREEEASDAVAVEDASASPEERARIEAAAYAHGRADGEAAARADVTPQVASAVAALADALERVRSHEAAWRANLEENLAALAVAVARHIIAHEAETDPAVVADLVRRALVQFPLDHQVTVRLHPDDVAACDSMLLSTTGNRTREIRWTPDPTVQRGGCLIEGRERIIDGRVDTALERVYRTIGNLQS